MHFILEPMHKRYYEDNQLLDKARTGDENAFTELFHHYYNSTLRYMMKCVKNQVDAEDLAMITIEKAFSNLDKYTPTFGFGTWLSKVARNTVFDFFNQKKRKPSDFIDVFDTNIQISHSNTPEEQYIHKEMGANLEVAICKLQQNYQEVIRWRYYENLNFKEINSKYGVDEKNARSYMFRARKQLREITL